MPKPMKRAARGERAEGQVLPESVGCAQIVLAARERGGERDELGR
jgi:hypothetical protein